MLLVEYEAYFNIMSFFEERKKNLKNTPNKSINRKFSLCHVIFTLFRANDVNIVQETRIEPVAD